LGKKWRKKNTKLHTKNKRKNNVLITGQPTGKAFCLHFDAPLSPVAALPAFHRQKGPSSEGCHKDQRPNSDGMHLLAFENQWEVKRGSMLKHFES